MKECFVVSGEQVKHSILQGSSIKKKEVNNSKKIQAIPETDKIHQVLATPRV